MTKDMTKGSPWRLILFFSMPVLLGNLFQQLYSMVDTVIVGRFVGTQALAAVGSTSAISFLVLGFSWGVTGGFTVIVSQKFGAKNEEDVKKSIGTAIVLCLIIVAIVTVLALLTSKPLLKLMNTPQDIFDDAYLYCIIIYIGTGASVFYNLAAAIIRALGDSRTPLYFLIFSSVLNIILDLFLILVFKMGVAGAGIATVFSQLVSAILCTIYSLKKFKILRLKKRHFAWNKALAAAELKVGIPMACQFSITGVGIMVLQGALNVFGSTVIASYTAASKVEVLVTQPFNALGMAMSTYCGQNVGAGDWHRVKKGVNTGMGLIMASAALAMVINIFAGEWCTSLFINNPTPEILGYGRTYLLIIAFFYPMLATLTIYRSSLQGLGDGLFPLIGGIGEFMARFLVAIILPRFIGFYGICAASPVAWCTASGILVYRYVTWVCKGKINNTITGK